MAGFTQQQPGRSIIPLGNGVSRRGSYNEAQNLYDMKNCDCDGQSASKRAGSRNLLPPLLLNGHFILDDLGWTETVISESRLMFGVNSDGSLFAISETYPQVMFQVWSRIRSTASTPISLPTVFDAAPSSRYYSIDTERYFFIVDDRMNALRIDKRGKIEWWYGSHEHRATCTTLTPNRYQYKTGAESTVVSPLNAAKLYVDCQIATNELPEDVVRIQNKEGNIYPVKGTYRTAKVNDCGVIGEWSRPVPIPEWSEHYYSKHRGVPIFTLPARDGKYIELAEGAPTLGAVTGNRLYLGYADGATQPSLSTSFVGTGIANESTACTIVYKNGRWLLHLSLATTDYVHDYLEIQDAQIFVPTIDDDGYKHCTLTPVDLDFVESDIDFGIVLDAAVVMEEYSATSKTKYRLDGITSPISSMTLKNSGKLSAIIGQFGGNPAFVASWIAGEPEISNIIIKAKITNKHLNRTFYAPWSDTDILKVWQHIGADTWRMLPTAPTSKSDWTYDNDAEKVRIGSSDLLGDVILTVPSSGTVHANSRFAIQENEKTTLISQRYFCSDAGYPIYDVDAADYLTGCSLYERYSPIMSPHLRSIRNIDGYMIREGAKTPRGCISKPAYNGSRMFYVDGSGVVTSDLTLLDLGNVKGISGTARVVVPFGRGCLVFTDNGAYQVDEELVAKLVGDGKPSSIAIPFLGMAASISDDNEIIMYRIEYDMKGIPHTTATSLSANIPDVLFSHESRLAFADDTLFVSAGSDIWGFGFGAKSGAGWKKKYNFDDITVKSLGVFNNRLVVLFNQEPDITRAFTPVDTISK